MIRRMQRADIDRVADIWLDTNITKYSSCNESKRDGCQTKP